jgi:hypothetical protein
LWSAPQGRRGFGGADLDAYIGWEAGGVLTKEAEEFYAATKSKDFFLD